MFHKEEKTITNAQNPKAINKLLFKGEKKRIVKATPNERTEAAKQIVKLSTKRTMLAKAQV